MARLAVCQQDFFGDLGKQSEKSERCQSHARVSGEPSHGLGFVFPILPTLYGRARYPLCGGCRCRPKRPMGSRQLAPKGMRRIRSEGLDGCLVGILSGPGITGGSFPFLYRKSAGLATPNGPRLRTCVRAAQKFSQVPPAGTATSPRASIA
jgi:hypothetical protein